ncbi:MAG: FIST N-terminal domain-containing protein, partial [Bdellovibrionales bacterium]
MSLFTSSQFASAAARGTDWRDTAKAVLDKLESVKTKGADFNVGFLYISDVLADDAESILNLFKSVLTIEHWVGCVAMGVCANGEVHVDVPAISTMIGAFEPDDFCVFPAMGPDQDAAAGAVAPWLKQNDPMLVVTHGDPMTEIEPGHALKTLNAMTQGFLVGGLSSSRHQQMQFADGPQQDGYSGVIFSQNIAVATTLSQGCKAIGAYHTITRCEDNHIIELDNQSAVSVFEEDLRSMAMQAVGRDPDQITVGEIGINDPSDLPEAFQSVFKGNMHVAFSVSESDQQDYMVRNIMGLDPDHGVISVSQFLTGGERVMFGHRNDETVREDLAHSLVNLRKRVQRDTGTFEPKGALYVSCVARA